jgi:hypothetical protein
MKGIVVSLCLVLCLVLCSTFILGWMRGGYIDKTGWSISPKISSRQYQPIYARNAALERESTIAAQNGDIKTAEADLQAILTEASYPGKAAVDSRVRAELTQLCRQKSQTRTVQ